MLLLTEINKGSKPLETQISSYSISFLTSIAVFRMWIHLAMQYWHEIL